MRSNHLLRITLAASLVFLSSTPSGAQDRPERSNLTRASAGFTYFNRVGSTMNDLAVDVRSCIDQTAALSRAAENPLQGGVLPLLIAQGQDEAHLQANIENCMVVEGWRVVRLRREEGRFLNDLSRAELAGQLSLYVGSATPRGEIVRTFANEAARGDTIWGGVPAAARRDMLSLNVVEVPNPFSGRALPPRLATTASVPATPLASFDPASIPEGSAVVFVKVAGTGRTNGEGFSFVRINSVEETTGTNTVDGQWLANNFNVSVRWTLLKGSAQEPREALVAYAVAPGRWRLGARMNTLGFCFGSPATQINAGDVVFLGTWNLAGDLGPDMSLDPASRILEGHPDLLQRLRPAQWVNGVRTPCGAVYNYALEIPGAPFEAGYVGGSSVRR